MLNNPDSPSIIVSLASAEVGATKAMCPALFNATS